MQQTTPSTTGPRKETLLFLRTFARVYHPTLCDEASARQLAQRIASSGRASC